MSPPLPRGADVVGLGVVRPAPLPVIRPAPDSLPGGTWPAHLVDPPQPGQAASAPPRKRGRVQAMALAAVRQAVESCAEPPGPGSEVGLCMGTAWAELGDELAFLENMIRRGEIGARPAYFTNSVHNALASRIAIELKWEGENHTFTHDALSFESALWQGIFLLHAGRAARVVVCGADGLNDFLELRGHLLGHYREDPAPLFPPSGHSGRGGSIPGEGAAALVLSLPGSCTAPLARVAGVRARGPARRDAVDAAQQPGFIEASLAEMGRAAEELDFVLLGAGGDPATKEAHALVRDHLASRLPPGAGIGVYRHLTGEFATASALGLALAVRMVSEKRIPGEVRCIGPAPVRPPGAVLLYHLSPSGQHSVMLVHG